MIFTESLRTQLKTHGFRAISRIHVHDVMLPGKGFEHIFSSSFNVEKSTANE